MLPYECLRETRPVNLEVRSPLIRESYYLTNKRSLHVRSQGLEILTLIGET